MRNPKISILTALVLLAVACGKNDDDTLASQVAGSYTGQLTASVQGMAFPAQPGTLSITAEDGGTATVVVPSYDYEGHATLDASTVTGVSVSQSGTGYTLYRAEGADTLRASIAGDSVSLTFHTKPGAMPMPIDFSFEGRR